MRALDARHPGRLRALPPLSVGGRARARPAGARHRQRRRLRERDPRGRRAARHRDRHRPGDRRAQSAELRGAEPHLPAWLGARARLLRAGVVRCCRHVRADRACRGPRARTRRHRSRARAGRAARDLDARSPHVLRRDRDREPVPRARADRRGVPGAARHALRARRAVRPARAGRLADRRTAAPAAADVAVVHAQAGRRGLASGRRAGADVPHRRRLTRSASEAADGLAARRLRALDPPSAHASRPRCRGARAA